MTEETIDKTFNVTGAAMLELNNICGSVQILPGQEDLIQVTAVKHLHSGDENLTRIEITQGTDGTVRASSLYTDSVINLLCSMKPCDVDFVVKVPLNCSMKLNGVSNSVKVEGISGAFKVKTVSGDVSLRELNGEIRLHAVSGNIYGEHLTGSLHLDIVSGDVAMDDSAFQSIRAETVSGNLQLQTALTEGPYQFHSVSGDICLWLPADTGCLAELHSMSGDLVSVFPVSATSHSLVHQVVKIGDGGTQVLVNSVSGSLRLECIGGIPTIEPQLREERLSVLGRIERGEMTVEEALSQLQASRP